MAGSLAGHEPAGHDPRVQQTGQDDDGFPRPSDDAPPLREVVALRGALTSALFPLDIPGAAAARSAARDGVAQLDDYVLPRFRRLEAPVLAVVGGSTGAGKSTLVNALVREVVTRSGAIRPTTRAPVLVHHPDDAPWFADARVLPGLARLHHSAATGGDGSRPSRRPAGSGQAQVPGGDGAAGLVLAPTTAVGPGLALLDAPDVDSVVDANRALAGQLLAAADLWLFVTSAARYADAVPWALLREAAARDAVVAVVLDRVPAAAVEDVREDLRAMLDAEGLGQSPLLTVLETDLADALLPEAAVAQVREWLDHLTADAAARAQVVRRTLTGAVLALADRAEGLAAAADAQVAGEARVRSRIEAAYEEATETVVRSSADGTLLRGEVLARWQEFVGTGEIFRGLQGRVGALRDRVGAFLRGRPAPVATVGVAIEQGVAALVLAEATAAADRVRGDLDADPAGRALLAGLDLPVTAPGFDAEVAAEIRRWQGALLDLVRSQGQDKRTTARLLALGVNGVAVALMIVAFASTGGLLGAEIGIAGGAAVLGQKVLEAVFGDQAVRDLARAAQEDLRARCERLMTAERDRYLALVDGAGVDRRAGEALRASARAAREALATTTDLATTTGLATTTEPAINPQLANTTGEVSA